MPKILVADDSLSVRKVAERMLTEAGLEVALAANGEEAMLWLSTNQPDLVIADVIMPDKSGFEVCAYVRAQGHLANTPVLLISGFVDDEVTRQAEVCRADGVVKKPFQGAALREQVMALLAARKEPEAPAVAPAVAPAAVTAAPAAIEMPVFEPEPTLTLEAAPPRPTPVAAPAAVAMPAAAPATAQFDEEMRAFREIIHKLEGRVGEQEQGLVRLEQHLQAARESTTEAVTKAQTMEARLAEAEKQSAELRKRLADLEPAAASATKLLQALTEFARQVLKAGESGKP
jgi:CheY-like chemotaxis protein